MVGVCVSSFLPTLVWCFLIVLSQSNTFIFNLMIAKLQKPILNFDVTRLKFILFGVVYGNYVFAN